MNRGGRGQRKGLRLPMQVRADAWVRRPVPDQRSGAGGDRHGRRRARGTERGWSDQSGGNHVGEVNREGELIVGSQCRQDAAEARCVVLLGRIDMVARRKSKVLLRFIEGAAADDPVLPLFRAGRIGERARG